MSKELVRETTKFTDSSQLSIEASAAELRFYTGFKSSPCAEGAVFFAQKPE
jgi:hypothetical protein